MKHPKISRRQLLRGTLGGATISVGLPLLDLFLDENGTALANGAPLPTCFGTWYWGLGLCHGNWIPEKTGSDYQLLPQLHILESVREHINIYSGTEVILDGNPSQVHFSGQQCIMTGRVSDQVGGFGRSIDEVVAEKLNVRTRFKSLTVSCDGNPLVSYSSRGGNAINQAEISPLKLYQRIFSEGFQDPNAGNFTPDPDVMLRKSALSFVGNERQALMKHVGASDRAQLDEFFTSLRSLEQKLALELEKPEPMAACETPLQPQGEHPNLEIKNAIHTHELFADLVAHALACGQTRIFNMTLSHDLVKAGDPSSAHVYTHEEATDPVLGYQPMSFWFATQYMSSWRHLVTRLAGIKEGDGTLLDRTLVLAFSDHGDSRIHGYKEMPYFTAGRAGGGIETGIHVSAPNDPCGRVVLTCLQAMGLPVESWGEGSNRVMTPFSEVLT